MTERSIASLCKRSHEMSRSKGWYNGEEKDPRPMSLITLLMQSEISEALEEWRAHKKLDELYYSYKHVGHEMTISHAELDKERHELECMGITDFKPEGILVELADVVIRICQRCGSDETPLEAIINTSIPSNVQFTADFETMLATCMADIAMSYLVTTPGGKAMATAGGLPTKPEFFWAAAVAGVFSWAEQNHLDLWSSIELKEQYNSTRPQKHGGKKA
jgi:hypothetical protein